MNLSPSWVGFLEARGISSLHWSSAGRATAPDVEILAYAKRQDFVVFTHDLDLGQMLVMDALRGPSVLQVRTQDVLPSAIGELVLGAIQVSQLHLEAGALVTVDAVRRRVRILPLSAEIASPIALILP